MSKNVVFMIGEKRTGRIFEAGRDAFVDEITFKSFLPERWVAENFRNRELGDRHGEHYVIIEAEVVEFINNQLTVAYENFYDKPPF
jgi:hypothetical protein